MDFSNPPRLCVRHNFRGRIQEKEIRAGQVLLATNAFSLEMSGMRAAAVPKLTFALADISREKALVARRTWPARISFSWIRPSSSRHQRFLSGNVWHARRGRAETHVRAGHGAAVRRAAQSDRPRVPPPVLHHRLTLLVGTLARIKRRNLRRWPCPSLPRRAFPFSPRRPLDQKRPARFALLRCAPGPIRGPPPLARKPRPPFAPRTRIRAHYAPLGRPDSLDGENASGLPAPSAKRTGDRPRRLQRPWRRALRLPRHVGRRGPTRSARSAVLGVIQMAVLRRPQ